MNRYLRLRWLVLILILEGVLFLSVFDIEAVISALNAPAPVALRAPLTPPPVISEAEDYRVLALHRFKNLATLKEWDERIFKGGTEYQVLQENGVGYLRSKSVNSCSGLYVKTDFPASADLYISWKWRAHTFPKKKRPDIISDKAGDDFAARVYVIFPGANFFKSDVIEYIWDEQLPMGTTADSPYSDRIQLMVLRSGALPEGSSEWFEEERNIREDYLRLYGKEPQKPVGAIALMSDSDNTGTRAEADFADIAIKVKRASKTIIQSGAPLKTGGGR